jgi:GT2 family glycosyltransferase
LRQCADGVLNGTDYPRIELVILDNGSREPAAVELLAKLGADERVRVLARPGPFNWSVLNNEGARAARGEVLILMNNDIAILQRDWADELVAQAMRPEIGAVGAKLLYPDGTLQHAGMVIDTDGLPKHVLRNAAPDTTCLSGIFGVPHSVSLVTGACLALRRSVFHEVGGLDEGLAVACNDVDFCLRLLAHGYRNIWTPFAVLEHREQASRGADRTRAMGDRAAAEFRHLGWNWGGALLSDRYFNPNLILIDDQPRLRPHGS